MTDRLAPSELAASSRPVDDVSLPGIAESRRELTPMRAPVLRKPPIRAEEVADAIAEIDPFQHLPVELHEQARAFIAWLETVSEIDPSCCHYCGSFKRTVRVSKGPRTPRTLYTCRNCNECYNSLTGTSFEGMRHAHLWHAFMRLRFAGWSVLPITKRLKISRAGACGWDRQCLVAMQDHSPELHRWWSTHQDRDDLAMPPQLQLQADDFVSWVETMSRESGRLTGTPFERLAFRARWVPFARLWLNGLGDLDITRELDMCSRAVRNWRDRYERATSERYPDLLQWVRWQRARRFNEVSQMAHRNA